jgi:hypothetical protein
LTTSRRSSGGRRADINPAYGDALLMGIGEAEALANEETVFAAVQHLAALEDAGNDLWLGSAIRPYLKTAPLDIVTLPGTECSPVPIRAMTDPPYGATTAAGGGSPTS